MSEHQGHRKRLRERANRTGLAGFQPHEVLEMLLSETIPRRNVNPLAHALIERFGSFSAVLDASKEALMQVEGVGEHTADHLCRQPDYYAYYEYDRWAREKAELLTVQRACNYCTSMFGRQQEEALAIVCMDVRKAVIAHQVLSVGTVDEAPIYPRMVAEAALRYHAHSVILVHNHPSGSAEPSVGDVEVSRRVSDALQTLEIKLVDHIIVAGPQALSLKEAGYLDREGEHPLRGVLQLARGSHAAADRVEENDLPY